jgi:glycosyltransferase involved in cell wall biosynthesis
MIPRVAFIFTHRIQYFSNLLDELQRRGRIEPVAVYAHDTATLDDSGFGRRISWDNRRDSNFAEVLLPHPAKQTQGSFFSSFNIALARNLDRLKPDCIHLNGYAKAIQWQAWSWARKRKVPILLRGDGDILGRNNGWRPLIRIWPARIFARAAAHVFFQGEENRKYWLARGAVPGKMSWIPCVSDSQIFRKKAFESVVERDAFRAANHADPQDVVFVISGKLKQRKRPADAIEALARCGAENVRLWFLGSGPLQTGLKALAASRKVEGKITWFGFRNQTELPAILQAADVLLHSSERDPWPYSVLEGAISGLALLLSDRVGSHPDWLELPPACQVFPCGNTEQLALAISRFAQDRNLLADLQCSARMKADRHTEREFCNQFESAVSKVCISGWLTNLR